MLYGQEVNPETYAICTSDMLIKGEKSENIVYGSTLSKDGFPHLNFDFQLSNPPYGKTWKIDVDTIVSDRGKKDKQVIKDPRFQIGLPSISDGQLLFLLNMVSKMKHNTELGSRIASVHNGSALFTGDAGGGESEIRKYIIENDFLECIIALPTNIFYNTGIPTYIFILSNRKSKERKGFVQLINAKDLSVPLKKGLGDKNCEIQDAQIKDITNTYLKFEESEISKIFPNKEFGFNQITVERPLRLAISLTDNKISNLKFSKELFEEMKWIYTTIGEDVYSKLEKHKERIELHFKKEEYKLENSSIKKLVSEDYWQEQKKIYEIGKNIQKKFGNVEILNFNDFKPKLIDFMEKNGVQLSAPELKYIIDKISYKNQNAEKVIKKINKDKIIEYEADTDLRDVEFVPLDIEIENFYKKEVIPYIPDAWIDKSKTTKGYEIKFAKYFYNKPKLGEADKILEEIMTYKQEEICLLKSLNS
jgi:type I restriction enzyme M protein